LKGDWIRDRSRLYRRFHCHSVADDHRSSATEWQWNLLYNLNIDFFFRDIDVF
jgi:hypothetical protein